MWAFLCRHQSLVLMIRSRPVLVTLAALLLALGGVIASLGAGSSAQAATSTLCQSQTASVAGGAYTVQNNEWGSSASECITNDGNADFTSWSTTQPGGSNAYDVAYDIWFNSTPTTTGQPNGAELMIWLNHNGSVQPFGSQVATGTSVGGRGYNVWFGTQGWNTISYTMTAPTTSVSGLDLAPIVQDAISRGYIQPSWYLIDVEAGFELWQGGAGLATNSFSVNVAGTSGGGGGGGTPLSAACTGTYSVTSSWSGGFQGQVVVKNTGSGTLNGWQLGWTFPGSQAISSLWNGSYTQSGSSVTVASTSYNATLAPSATTTVGFTATGASASPSSVTCT
jgi:cellulose 1,4-beta-cellobiosidase